MFATFAFEPIRVITVTVWCDGCTAIHAVLRPGATLPPLPPDTIVDTFDDGSVTMRCPRGTFWSIPNQSVIKDLVYNLIDISDHDVYLAALYLDTDDRAFVCQSDTLLHSFDGRFDNLDDWPQVPLHAYPPGTGDCRVVMKPDYEAIEWSMAGGLNRLDKSIHPRVVNKLFPEGMFCLGCRPPYGFNKIHVKRRSRVCFSFWEHLVTGMVSLLRSVISLRQWAPW